ncbi:hypothetical protein KCP74_14625 [Salmonella enterica subsp. enterica]|nr:hypothetical protein KCP74_14625 [Salmonella enterica subsp. enterica]
MKIPMPVKNCDAEKWTLKRYKMVSGDTSKGNSTNKTRRRWKLLVLKKRNNRQA